MNITTKPTTVPITEFNNDNNNNDKVIITTGNTIIEPPKIHNETNITEDKPTENSAISTTFSMGESIVKNIPTVPVITTNIIASNIITTAEIYIDAE